MTHREPDPEPLRCPECTKSDRAEPCDPPKHMPTAKAFCDRCKVFCSGSASEAMRVAAAKAARDAERGAFNLKRPQ